MLKGLLENKICASCKICCGFDNTDLWEMPVMNEKTRRRLAELRPNVEFIEKDGGFVVDAGNLPDGELFYCPALDPLTALYGRSELCPLMKDCLL